MARNLVIATGGLSIPKIGASDFAYRVACQFGLRVVEPRPALVPLTFDGAGWAPYAQLAGLSLPVQIATGSTKSQASFLEDLLFTHLGLSGPAVLQISSYWSAGTPIRLDRARAHGQPLGHRGGRRDARHRRHGRAGNCARAAVAESVFVNYYPSRGYMRALACIWKKTN